MNQIIVDGFVNQFTHGLTSTGSSWCRFSLSNSTYSGKDDEGKTQYNKNWFNVSAFEGLADVCIKTFAEQEGPFLVQVVGQMEQREYVTDEGESRKAYGLKAREISRAGNVSSFAKESSAPVAATSSGPTF